MNEPPQPGADAATPTPVRRLDLPRRDGCLVLPGGHGAWVDGGEARIADIVLGAGDRSALSDELGAHRTDWIERYHLSPERANVLRGLDIAPDATVLEIGAGCGAVTRYLGEIAATVDAIEPTPARAAVARMRTQELPGVEVFVGELPALPAEPAYDLIAIIGVLEYVGGAAGPEPRIELLREAAARLKVGGAVVCGIENQLGVKYLAGAPEDHAGAPFEGIEDYPRGGPFRTFSRRALEHMFRAAGLAPEIYHAFPDYKLPRLIYADALLEGDAAPLAWRAARFPSPDAPLPRAKLAHEGRLWRSAVHAGLGGELANSFVVVGRSGGGSPWPEGQQAVFWSIGRRARFSTESRLVAEGEGGGARLERRYLQALDGPRGRDGLEHACASSRFVDGPPLSELLEAADEDQLDTWLERWRGHVENGVISAGQRRNIDVTATNVIVDGDDLVTIDEEWWHSGYSPEDAIDRAMLNLAFELAEKRAPERWPEGCSTVRDVLNEIYSRSGRTPPTDERVSAAVEREAALQAQIRVADPSEPAWSSAAARYAHEVNTYLGHPLSETSLGRRDTEGLTALRARVAELSAVLAVREKALAQAETELRRGDRELYALKDRFDELYAAHEAVVGSKAWRFVAAARKATGRANRTT